MTLPADNTDLWAIVPVKALHSSKSRLAGVLSVAERRELTQQLLRRVLTALRATPEIAHILVVSRDEAVRRLAAEYHSSVLAESNPDDLNGALTEAAQFAYAHGARAVLVLPSDLPLLTVADVQRVTAAPGAVVIVSDRRIDGTNALLLRDLPAFRFRFGEDSFAVHLGEARRQRCVPQVVGAPGIEFDLDTPADWFHYQGQHVHNPTA